MATEWNINTDIYSIVESIRNLQKRYIEDEDETTLALGPFGFITDTEAKKIQTQTIMAGQLGNEMFANRAKLTKNVLTHAAYNGITEINAVPAYITITLCIKMEDIDKYKKEDKFYLDAECPIFIGDYEFHLDYDVMISKVETSPGSGEYAYAAQYIVEDEDGNKIVNRLSDIINPYLRQPFVITIGKFDYLAIQVTVRQCTIETTRDTMVSDSIIENKSYTFEFDNQMADFRVVVTDNGVDTELRPYLYGSAVDPEDPYCWYLYTSDNSIRITFDSLSFIPGLSSEIYIKAYTTKGADGNFNYLGMDTTSDGLYTDIKNKNSKYGYTNIITYLVAVTDSINGANKKSKEELQELIPKTSMARGSITTDKDLNNYFNLINTDINRLVMMKKEDSQLNRIWYGYFVLKDFDNNIIPTNTVKLQLMLSSAESRREDKNYLINCGNGQYLLPAGTLLQYDPATDIATPIDASYIPEEYSDLYFYNGYFYYITIYNIIFDTGRYSQNAIHSAYYMVNTEYVSYFLYDYVNTGNKYQFIANRYGFKRDLIVEQADYKISFNIAQSILYNEEPFNYTRTITVTNEDGTLSTRETTNNNLVVVLVLYQDGEPFRWTECTYVADSMETDPEKGIYHFEAIMGTNNQMDDKDRIYVQDLHVAGTGTETTTYGYMDDYTEAAIYILVKTPVDTSVEFPRRDLDEIAPGVYDDYVLTNVYVCATGLNFFENYTPVTNTKIERISGKVYNLHGIPVLGRHYATNNENINFFTQAVKEKRAYIDNCLKLVENSMLIDYKFFNTYGYSHTFMLEDEHTTIKNVDITMKFKLSLKDSADTSTKDDIVLSIKKIIENLNDTDDLHIPNLITDIINEYEDRINFIEYVGFNEFGPGDQHIITVEPEDPFVVPEFINIRNIINPETNRLEPAIEIELV